MAIAEISGLSPMNGSRDPRRIEIVLADADATARAGQALAPHLAPGDLVLLAGGLGAGKSALARALIRSQLGQSQADVPSPSYTLINIYEAPGGPIWHADLYRLAGADEALELGLEEAIAEAILIVEWPDRFSAAFSGRRLDIGLVIPERAGRIMSVAAHGPGWTEAMRSLECLG